MATCSFSPPPLSLPPSPSPSPSHSFSFCLSSSAEFSRFRLDKLCSARSHLFCPKRGCAVRGLRKQTFAFGMARGEVPPGPDRTITFVLTRSKPVHVSTVSHTVLVGRCIIADSAEDLKKRTVCFSSIRASRFPAYRRIEYRVTVLVNVL